MLQAKRKSEKMLLKVYICRISVVLSLSLRACNPNNNKNPYKVFEE